MMAQPKCNYIYLQLNSRYFKFQFILSKLMLCFLAVLPLSFFSFFLFFLLLFFFFLLFFYFFLGGGHKRVPKLITTKTQPTTLKLQGRDFKGPHGTPIEICTEDEEIQVFSPGKRGFSPPSSSFS